MAESQVARLVLLSAVSLSLSSDSTSFHVATLPGSTSSPESKAKVPGTHCNWSVLGRMPISEPLPVGQDSACPTPAHSWTGSRESLWGKVLGLAGGVDIGREHLSPGDSDVLFNTVSVTIEMIWKEKK